MSSRLRSTLAWVALFATLLGACAPTLTRFMGAARGVPLALSDICHVNDSPHRQGDQPAPLHGESCPFCFNHATAHAPPQALFQWVPQVVPAFFAPAYRATLAEVPEVWGRPQPRGPPASA